MHGEGDVQQVAAPTDAAIRVCKTAKLQFTLPDTFGALDLIQRLAVIQHRK